jgi:hypothetical protein
MLHSRSFWLAQGVAIVLFHLLALVLLLTGNVDHPLVVLWGIVLVIHAGELVAAFIALKGLNVPPLTLIAKTLTFGFIWWLPRRLGVYQS